MTSYANAQDYLHDTLSQILQKAQTHPRGGAVGQDEHLHARVAERAVQAALREIAELAEEALRVMGKR